MDTSLGGYHCPLKTCPEHRKTVWGIISHGKKHARTLDRVTSFPVKDGCLCVQERPADELLPLPYKIDSMDVSDSASDIMDVFK